MIIAVNYANDKFKKAQQWNTKSAYKHKVDKVYAYGPEDIDENFRNKNEKILSTPRGNGLWLWKPYFILKTMQLHREGDWLVYVDSGLCYENDADEYFQMLEEKCDIICSRNRYLEREYTRRDTFIIMNCDSSEYVDTPQRFATAFCIKISKKTIEFVEEWLSIATNYQAISDTPNIYGYDNYPEFIDHRHDQSIFSLLTKKNQNELIIKEDLELFSDIELRKKHHSLLSYHHSGNGNLFMVIWHRRMDPVYFNYLAFKGWVKKTFFPKLKSRHGGTN